MIKFTYDIPKNKMEVKADDQKAAKDLKQIVTTITICSTILIGFNLYLEYKKYTLAL